MRTTLLVALLALSVIPFAASAYDLSADTRLKEGNDVEKGKIYIKDDKYRIEREGDEDYILIRHDKGFMAVVVPDKKVYVQMQIDESKTPRINEKNPGEVARVQLGNETIDGHPTIKYKITVKEGIKSETFYQWTATDLNFPIKTASIDGSWSVEFLNIKSPAPDSVFSVLVVKTPNPAFK